MTLYSGDERWGITHNVLEPDLVETVECQTLDIRSGRLGQGSSPSLLDGSEGRLTGGSNGGVSHRGHAEKDQSEKLHLDERVKEG